MTIELTDQGLRTQTLAEIKQDYINSFIAKYGQGSQASNDKSNMGKMISIFSDRETLIHEAIEGVYQSQYPSTAREVSLDRVLEITGVTRQGATQSAVNTMYATGTVSSVVTAEELTMSVSQTSELFRNIASFSLGTIGDYTIDSLVRSGTTVTATISGGHSYPLNSWVFIEGADQDEYNVLAEITAVASTTFDYEISGVLPVSPATGTLESKEATNFTAYSVNTGAIQALQGSITTIETAVVGIDRVENSDDAVVGNDTETDSEARIRREASLSLQGGGTPETIKAAVLDVANVSSVIVFKNDSDIVDGDGIPPHSVEVYAIGSTAIDQEIFDALFSSVSAGIRQHGNVTGSVTDSSGNPQPCAFSRLLDVPIYIDLTVTTNTDVDQGAIFPVDGQAQIRDNLTSIIFSAGSDVWKALIENAVVSVQGVISVVSLFSDTDPPITDTTVVIGQTEIADIDSGDIDITVV